MSDHILTVSNLNKSFGGVKATNNVSFRVKRGEIYSIIGPNGAGKTTIFNCLAGAFKFDSGDITFDGNPITSGMLPHEICRLGLTRTYQIVKPFATMSVLDNVMVGTLLNTDSLAEAQEKAMDVLKLTMLDGIAKQRAGSLTVAGRKRLELARALGTNPKLLLLDEVMAGLNPSELQEMLSVLRAIHERGITLLIIEHLMDVIMNISERIFVIEQGIQICEGTPEVVSSDPRVIEAYFGKEK